MRAGLRAGSRVGHPRSTQRAGEERHIRDLDGARQRLTARGSRVCGFVLASGVCGAGGPGQQQQEDEGCASGPAQEDAAHPGAQRTKSKARRRRRAAEVNPLPSDGKAQVFTN
uniref:Uncharacterized protein n=1 Tax=Knipowitschia caucasica TaxID=637954 RepID=A0AAV2K1A9_KNICA